MPVASDLPLHEITMVDGQRRADRCAAGGGNMIAFIDAPEGYEVELIQTAKT